MKLWSSLNDHEKTACISQVLTRAGSEPAFRTKCLEQEAARDAIQDELKKMDVTLDEDSFVKCYPDKETTEKDILLRLPDAPNPDGGPYPPDGLWLCTYPTYNQK